MIESFPKIVLFNLGTLSAVKTSAEKRLQPSAKPDRFMVVSVPDRADSRMHTREKQDPTKAPRVFPMCTPACSLPTFSAVLCC